jgi:hypothetical protein
MGLMNSGNSLVRQVHPEDLRTRLRLKICRVTHKL